MVDFKFKFRMHGTFGISPYGIPAKTSLGSPYGLERHVGCSQRGVPPTKTADNSKNKKIRTRIQKRYARSRDWKGAWTNENPNKLRPGKNYPRHKSHPSTHRKQNKKTRKKNDGTSHANRQRKAGATRRARTTRKRDSKRTATTTPKQKKIKKRKAVVSASRTRTRTRTRTRSQVRTRTRTRTQTRTRS